MKIFIRSFFYIYFLLNLFFLSPVFIFASELPKPTLNPSKSYPKKFTFYVNHYSFYPKSFGLNESPDFKFSQPFYLSISKQLYFRLIHYPFFIVKADSLKQHSNRIKDIKPYSRTFLFINPSGKSSNHKFIINTLIIHPIELIKTDSASNPLAGNLFNVEVSSPIHSALTLTYSLNQENIVSAKLFSILGTEITTLFTEKQFPGSQLKTFYIADKLSSGIYILRLTAGNQRIAKRIQVF